MAEKVSAPDKYQILVEAVLKTTTAGKSNVQTGLNKLSKELELTIHKVKISGKGLAHIKSQLKSALSDFDVDLEKIEKGGEAAGKALGINVGKGYQKAAAGINKIVIENVDDIRKYYEGLGWQEISAKKIFDDEETKKYNVTLKKIVGNEQQILRTRVDINKNGKHYIKLLDESSRYTKSIADQTKTWSTRLEDIRTRNADVVKSSSAVRDKIREIGISMQKFTGATAERDKITQQFRELNLEVNKTKTALASAHKQGMTFTSMLSLALKKIVLWGIGTAVVYGTIRQIQKAVGYVKELNKEMTNIQIVSGASVHEIKNLAQEYNNLAIALGVTTLEVTKGSLEWIRQGKTAKETAELLRASTMMATLGNLDQAESTEYLTSIINGYDLALEEVMPTIDKLIALDNAYATSVGEIAAALRRAANSARLIQIPLENVAAMITVVSAVTRKSAESIGESFKTIFSRMRDVKLNKDIDEAGESISDVEKILARFGIELRDSSHQFRNMNDVLDETRAKWLELAEAGRTVDQSTIAKAFAGVRQAENFIALMNNQEMYIEALKIEAEALGTTEERYEIYVNSVEAASNRLIATWEKLVANTFTDELLKNVLGLGEGIIKFADAVGILNLAFVALGIYLTAKFSIILPFVGQQLAGLSAALSITTVAAEGLMVALSGVAIVLGIIAVIALGKIYSNWINGAEIAREKTIELKNEIDSLTRSIKKLEEERNSVSLLAQEFVDLQQDTKKSADEQERYVEVQNELKDLIPGLQGYYNDLGNFRITEIADLKTIIELRKEELSLIKETLKEKKIEGFEAELELYEELIKKQTRLQALSDMAEIRVADPWTGLPTTDVSAVNAEKARKDLKSVSDEVELFVNRTKQEFLSLDVATQNLFLDMAENLGRSDLANELRKLVGSFDVIAQRAMRALPFNQLGEFFDELNFVLSETLDELIDFDKQIFSIVDTMEEFGKISAEQVKILAGILSPADYDAIVSWDELNNAYKINIGLLKSISIANVDTAITMAYMADASDEVIESLRGYLELLATGDPFKKFGDNLKEVEQAEKDYQKALEDAEKEREKAYQDLLKATISMIKQRKEEERDALKDQLDGYKKIIDARKQIIDQEKKERDHLRAVKDQQKEITNIEEELMELQFDTSEEGMKRRLELEEQLFEEKRDLEDEEYDHSVDKQKSALDEEYDRFKHIIDKKLDVIQAYLQQSGTIAMQAITMIENRSDTFYQSLLEWNRIYGSGIDNDIVGAWNRAFMAASQYASVVGAQQTLSALTGTGYTGSSWGATEIARLQALGMESREYRQDPSMIRGYHEGGFVGGLPKIRSNEEYAKLMTGEFVSRPDQISNFMNKTLPNIVANTGGDGEITIHNEFNVAGNLDKSVIPIIDNKIAESLNRIMKNRGIRRNANAYSI